MAIVGRGLSQYSGGFADDDGSELAASDVDAKQPDQCQCRRPLASEHCPQWRTFPRRHRGKMTPIMDRQLRRAPDAEWVLMYRLGPSRKRIAELVRVHPRCRREPSGHRPPEPEGNDWPRHHDYASPWAHIVGAWIHLFAATGKYISVLGLVRSIRDGYGDGECRKH